MTFPRKLLHENEQILLDTRPHWWLLVFPGAVGFAAIGAAIAILVIWSSAPSWFGWVLLAVALVGVGYFFGRFLKWRSTSLVVTSMRVIYRSGVLRRTGREIPISSVQNVEYKQSLLERLMRKGRVAVESAGAHGEEPFIDIPHPNVVQGLINRAIDESRRRDAAQIDGSRHTEVFDEIERLDDLHRRGVITDLEFSKLKGDLIDKESSPHDEE